MFKYLQKGLAKYSITPGMVVIFLLVLASTVAIAQSNIAQTANTNTTADYIGIALRTAPGLTILGFIVWVFFKHLEKRDAAMADMGKNNHSMQEKAIEAINNNTKALGAHGEQFKQMGEYMRRMDRAVEDVEKIAREWRTPNGD